MAYVYLSVNPREITQNINVHIILYLRFYIVIRINECRSVSDTPDDDDGGGGGVVYLSQTERDVKCRLQLWSVYVSYRTAYADKTAVELSDDADVDGQGCWTPSGWYVFSDSSTGVRRARADWPVSETFARDVGVRGPIVAGKSGFLLYVSGRLKVSRQLSATTGTRRRRRPSGGAGGKSRVKGEFKRHAIAEKG